MNQFKLDNTFKVIIYGAGKIGQRIFDVCGTRGIEVIKVWDNFPEKVIAFSRPELIEKPSDLEGLNLSEIVVLVTPFSPNLSSSLADSLKGRGFKKVISNRSEISQIFIEHCNWLKQKNIFKFSLQDCFICPARRDEKVECNVFNDEVKNVNESNGQELVFSTLGLLLTTKCNLTCVGCNHLRDHFVKKDNVDFEADQIIDDLAKFLNAVDYVKSLVIVGGEALIHPNFNEIFKKILDFDKIGFVQIITNGTATLKNNDVFKLFQNKRVIVEISGYGEEPGHLRVKKRQKFIHNLQEHGISYRYDEAAQWIDFGGFERRNYSPDKWKEIYKSCCFVSNDLFNGTLHKCSRSAYGDFLGKTPHYDLDSVNVRTMSPDQLRLALKRYQKIYPQACQHCDGTTTNLMPAGVQVIKLKKNKLLDVIKIVT
jgi:hypothetical protein